ncbi:hypothetical protein RQN9TF_08555 [Rhodococcus qingshengii]|nr:hypothetical protein RQN9TF_08555 [Rhodococcus qingshengii]
MSVMIGVSSSVTGSSSYENHRASTASCCSIALASSRRCVFVGVMLCVGLRDGDLGLLLEPEALLPALDPPFVGNRDTFQRPTDGAAENEDQPPKVSEELERFVHTPMMPPLDRYHRWTDTTDGPIPPAGITLSRNGKKAGRE